ncbi:hypothetical protein [Pigmentibacter ruber]|uniref:hypothetical protein n=1 Tax=Pigmentibacter ruber TaxID=2683196 RepID=UPI00131C1FAE|nr:hypothetical protein [Pigmentibacter ruber]
MDFEKFLAKQMYTFKNELNLLTNDYSELKPHFSLSHNGILDNETEKLVESCSLFMTLSNAKMQGVIANEIKKFMEPIFPEWFLPEIPTYIIEYQNFDEFSDIYKYISENEVIPCDININDINYEFNLKKTDNIIPFKIDKSFFIPGEHSAFLSLIFSPITEDENIELFNSKIRLYFNHSNKKFILSLFDFIFSDKKNLLLTYNSTIFEIERNNLNFCFDSNKDPFNLFDKNKLFKIKNILNNLKNLFFIEINLASAPLITSDFELKIPINPSAYELFKHEKDFIKTNCFIVHNIYETEIPWSFISVDSPSEIEVASLKEQGILCITDMKIYDNIKDNEVLNEKHISMLSSLYFEYDIPFNIIHKILVNKEKLKKEYRIKMKGLATNIFSDYNTLQNIDINIGGKLGFSFGKILNCDSNHIFYSELLCDSKLFNFMYNANIFLPKKIHGLEYLLDYFIKIEKFYFKDKEIIFDFIKDINILKKEIYVCSKSYPQNYYSEYLISLKSSEKNIFLTQFLEFFLNYILEKDFICIINSQIRN